MVSRAERVEKPVAGRSLKGETPWQCSYPTCKKYFNRKGDLTRHENIHSGFRPFVCEWEGCAKPFNQKSALKTHLNTHTGEKPHRCFYCSMQFADPSSCTRHSNEVHRRFLVYSDRKLFPDCATEIKRRSAFVKHLAHKHGYDLNKHPEDQAENYITHCPKKKAKASNSSVMKVEEPILPTPIQPPQVHKSLKDAFPRPPLRVDTSAAVAPIVPARSYTLPVIPTRYEHQPLRYVDPKAIHLDSGTLSDPSSPMMWSAALPPLSTSPTSAFGSWASSPQTPQAQYHWLDQSRWAQDPKPVSSQITFPVAQPVPSAMPDIHGMEHSLSLPPPSKFNFDHDPNYMHWG